MNESDNQDETEINEFSISIGDDILAEALNAVEKRLYTKPEPGEVEESEIEFDIEVDLEEGMEFDNLLGDETLDELLAANNTRGPSNNGDDALREEISGLRTELELAQQAQNTATEAARDARDESRRTMLKHKRLVDANAQLNLDVQDLRDTLKQWEKMVSDLKAQAENQNSERASHRNRLKRDVDDAKRTSTERILKHLMVPMDHIDLALKHLDDTTDNVVIDGFLASVRELREGLEKAGLSVVDADPGMEFNPEVHEAIARIYSKDVPRSHIIEMHRRGFMLEGKLYRPSQVTVSGGEDPDLSNEE